MVTRLTLKSHFCTSLLIAQGHFKQTLTAFSCTEILYWSQFILYWPWSQPCTQIKLNHKCNWKYCIWLFLSALLRPEWRGKCLLKRDSDLLCFEATHPSWVIVFLWSFIITEWSLSVSRTKKNVIWLPLTEQQSKPADSKSFANLPTSSHWCFTSS